MSIYRGTSQPERLNTTAMPFIVYHSLRNETNESTPDRMQEQAHILTIV
jgi:hypothetical protein